MKKILVTLLLFAPLFLFAQYPTGTNKSRLGYQTTGDGLIWRGVAADTVTKPRTTANAYFQIDTVNGILRRYIATRGKWQTVGGAASIDSLIYATRYWVGSNFFPLQGGTLTGTGGAGFLGLPAQSGTPSTPASGFRTYANGAHNLALRDRNGWITTFDISAIANRDFAYPSVGGTFALGTGATNRVPVWTDANTLGSSNIQDNGTAVSILNSKPFMLGQWTTAGRPSGVNGYKGRNTTTGFDEGYFTSQWENYITSTGASVNQLATFTNAGKIQGSQYVTFDGSNTSFKHSSPSGGAGSGGIQISKASDNTAGQSTMIIKGTNSSIWSGIRGIVFQNHTEAIDFYSPTNFRSSLAVSRAWLGGAEAFQIDNYIIISKDGGTGINLTALKYASSPYPIINYSAKNHVFYAKTAAAWPDASDGPGAKYGTATLGVYEGSVKIGTALTAPTETLDIDGDLRVRDSTRLTSTPSHTAITGILTRDVNGWVGKARIGDGLTYAGDSLDVKNVVVARDSAYGLKHLYSDIDIQGDYIYAASKTLSKILIYNKTNPPDTLSAFYLSNGGANYSPRKIRVDRPKNKLYVLCDDSSTGSGKSRFFVYDITNGSSPTIFGSVDIGDGYYPSTFVVNDTLVYVHRITETLVYGVSPTGIFSLKGVISHGVFHNEMKFSNGFLFLAGTKSFTTKDTAYLQVYNTSTVVPTYVTQYKNATLSSFNGMDIFENQIFLVTENNYVALVDFYGSTLSLDKYVKIAGADGSSYLFPYNKTKGAVIKTDNVILVASSASKYLFEFSFPEFNLISSQEIDSNIIAMDVYNNLIHMVFADSSAGTNKIIKGDLQRAIIKPTTATPINTERYNTITSTTSPVTLSNTISDNLINQGGTQATFTFRLPASPVDGQISKATFANAVTALTIDGNGTTVTGTLPTTANIGQQIAFKNYTGLGWVRQL